MNSATPSAPLPSASGGSNDANPVVRFRENRAKFTLDELRPYLGQWVAFSKDGTRIEAAAADFLDLERVLVERGIDPQQVMFEQLFPEDTIFGGAELL
jgi:hypothetical protein